MADETSRKSIIERLRERTAPLLVHDTDGRMRQALCVELPALLNSIDAYRQYNGLSPLGYDASHSITTHVLAAMRLLTVELGMPIDLFKDMHQEEHGTLSDDDHYRILDELDPLGQEGLR